MISPEYFECESYAHMKESLEKGRELFCEKYDITITPLGGDNLTVYTSIKKMMGMATEVTFENLFSLTEDSIQVAIMTALTVQADDDQFDEFRIVRKSQPEVPVFAFRSLQEAVNGLADARNAEPSEAIYMEPVLKRGFFGKLFGSK